MAAADHIVLSTPIQTDFQRGELAPEMQTALNTESYAAGAERMRNLQLVLPKGIRRRPGSRYLNKISSSYDPRMFDVRFSDGVKGIVFLYATGASAGTGVISLYVPATDTFYTHQSQSWGGDDLPNLRWTSDVDTVFVFSGSYEPLKAVWNGSGLNLSAFAFDLGASASYQLNQPFFRYAIKSYTLTPSAYSGAITLTCSGNHWSSAHVGALVRYHNKSMVVTGYVSETQVNATVLEDLPPTYLYTVNSTAAFSVGDVVVGSTTNYEGYVAAISSATQMYVVMLSGDVTFSHLDILTSQKGQSAEFVDPTPADAWTDADKSSVYSKSGTPHASTAWDESAFSDVYGWPIGGAFHDQRLWLFGPQATPVTIRGSKTGEYLNFDQGDSEDADAIEGTIAGGSVGGIRHMASLNVLQVLCDNGIYFIPQGSLQPITPGTLAIRRQSDTGCGLIPPVEFDSALAFADDTGKSIRENVYNDDSDTYQADSLSILAPHLIGNPIDIAAGAVDYGPERFLYIVNSDGTIAQLLGIRKESLLGWTLWNTEGEYKAVACLESKVYTLVLRRSGEYNIEVMDENTYLDCAVSVSQSANKQVSGLSALEGSFVHAYKATTVNDVVHVDNWGQSNETVQSGATSFQRDVTDAEVGIMFMPLFRPMKPQPPNAREPLLGQPRRIVRMMVDTVDSASFDIDGTRILARQSQDLVELGNPLRTKTHSVYTLGWDDKGQKDLTQEDPFPLKITGIALEVAF